MKVKHFILFCSIALLIIACCKEEVPLEPQPNTIIGDWRVEQLIHAMHNHLVNPYFMVIDELEPTGTISFDADSTGYFHDSIPGTIFTEFLDFKWHHEILQAKLVLEFEDGETFAWILKQKPDTLEINVWDYHTSVGGSMVLYYWNFVLARID